MFEELIDPELFINDMVEYRRKENSNIRAVQLSHGFKIITKEGVMKGKVLDYLVQGTQGEFYIIDNKIFHQIYEVVLK